MEVRTITQVKLYKLHLNRVTDVCESTTLVAVSPEYDHLISWYRQQFAPEIYEDHNIYPGRVFRLRFLPESPIKMFNPCYEESLTPDNLDYFNHGVETEWVREEILPFLRNREFTWID